MFRNTEHDPLAVPARGVHRRASVGPTRRTAGVPWAETKLAPQREHEQYDLDPQNWEDEGPTDFGDGTGPQNYGEPQPGDRSWRPEPGWTPSYEDMGHDQSWKTPTDHFSSRTAAPGGVDTSAVSGSSSIAGGSPSDGGGVMSAAPATSGITDTSAAASSTMGSPSSPSASARADATTPMGPAADGTNAGPSGDRVSRRVANVLDREARAFMEREGNTDDRSELLYRARRHASTLTSTWSPEASHRVTEAFCGRVAAMVPSRPRVAAAQPVMFADFDDALLY